MQLSDLQVDIVELNTYKQKRHHKVLVYTYSANRNVNK